MVERMWENSSERVSVPEREREFMAKHTLRDTERRGDKERQRERGREGGREENKNKPVRVFKFQSQSSKRNVSEVLDFF